MGSILNVELSVEGKVFMICDFLFLDPYAPTTARKFIFRDITFRKEANIEYQSRITVHVYCKSKYYDTNCINEFDILVFELGDILKDEWWLHGIVYTNYEDAYNQGLTDILNLWQTGGTLDWFSLPIYSPIKEDYFSACLHYSGIRTETLENEVYRIDFSLIKEERDFLYLVSLEFFGERGYLGSSIFTFGDCLLEIYNRKGYQYDRRILFLNIDKVCSPEIIQLIEETKTIFLKYGYSVEVI